MKNKKVLYITNAGVIAAMYVALTFLSNLFGLAYGAVQFRLSELLCILPLFTPAAIPGLTIGCVLANLNSPFGVVDIVFGSLATLIGAVLTYLLRKVTVKKLPLLSMFMPVLANAVIVGAEITFFAEESGSKLLLFLYNFATVGLGELVMCVALGIPFYYLIQKTGVFSKYRK